MNAWGPPLGYAALIFYLSSQSVLPGVFPEVQGMDKVVHAVEYALLSGLIARALLKSARPGWRAHAPHAAIVASVLYALSDELHQALVPGRMSQVSDWLADAVGAIAVQLAIIAWVL